MHKQENTKRELLYKRIPPEHIMPSILFIVIEGVLTPGAISDEMEVQIIAIICMTIISIIFITRFFPVSRGILGKAEVKGICKNITHNLCLSCYQRFPLENVMELICNSKAKVNMLYIWVPYLSKFEDPFIKAAMMGAEIKVLILDEDSTFAMQRSLDIGYSDDINVKGNIKANKEELIRIITKHSLSSKIQIGFYNVLPSVQLCIVDDRIFISFFLKDRHASNSTTLEVDANSICGNIFSKEFEKIWEKAKKM